MLSLDANTADAMGFGSVNKGVILGGYSSVSAYMSSQGSGFSSGSGYSVGSGKNYSTGFANAIAISAASQLSAIYNVIRADIGSVQNQVTSTINNITVTQVNVKAAESQIRDVDFAAESANYSKANILAQSGSYAMAQANSVQQNVLRLLQ